jgi:Flp pilus assembly protein CpaB
MITSDEEGNFTNYRSLMNFNPGDPILKPGLTLERRTKQPLAPEVPVGLRGISLPVTSTASVSNLIETGDRIDVLIRVQVPKVEEREVNISGLQGQQGNFNIPTQMETQEAVVVYMLQDATVLATGNKVIGHQLRRQYADEFELGYDSITIAVAPEEAPVLVLAMAMNNDNPFVMLLRNPADDTMLEEPIVANYRALLDTARLTNLLQNRRQRQVEVIQGGQRR